MKKIFSLLVILFVLSGCESDVKFSDPGLQGRKDNLIWRSDVTVATFENDLLVLTAYRGVESMTLTMPAPTSAINSSNVQTYIFDADHDQNDAINATYGYLDNGAMVTYTTGFDEDGEVAGNVEIVLNKFDPEKMVVSGSFKFNAKYFGDSNLYPDTVNFQEGAFFNIQLQ